jgi:DNA-binding NarL/FixJ family response regulator
VRVGRAREVHVTKTKALKLVVVDDEPLVRTGIASVVATVPGWSVAGAFATSAAALAAISDIATDVVVLDSSGNDGVTIGELRCRSAHSRVLVFSGRRNDQAVLDAFAAGANGYALKEETPKSLLDAIELVGGGGRYISPLLRDGLVSRIEREDAAAGREAHVLAELSNREREIFTMTVEGLSNVRMAKALSISIKTVDAHRRSINAKLGCHSTTDLVLFAALNGLLCDNAQGAQRRPLGLATSVSTTASTDMREPSPRAVAL